MEDDGKIEHIGSVLQRRGERAPILVESVRLLTYGLRREVTSLAQRMRRCHDVIDLDVNTLQQIFNNQANHKTVVSQRYYTQNNARSRNALAW